MSGEKKRGGRPRKEQKRVRVDTYMDPELAQRLFDHCRRTGFSYSKIIEIAVKNHLDEIEGPYFKEEINHVNIQFDEKGRPHYPGEEQ